jgi:uncharacterized membrane protein
LPPDPVPDSHDFAAWSSRDVDVAISIILRSGLLLATVVLALGALWYFSHIGSPAQPQGPDLHTFNGEPAAMRELPSMIESAMRGDGRAIMQLGICLLLATPFVRVLFAIYAFYKQRDHAYVVISTIVLAALLLGLYLGAAG